MRRRLSEDERQQAATITAWLSALVHAWATDDVGSEAQARETLRTMGVAIALPQRTTGGQADV